MDERALTTAIGLLSNLGWRGLGGATVAAAGAAGAAVKPVRYRVARCGLLLGVNKADRSISAAGLVLALLPETIEQFIGSQNHVQQPDLAPDRCEVARREIVQLVQRRTVLGFVRAAELLGLREKQLPALLWLQVVELDLEREAAQ